MERILLAFEHYRFTLALLVTVFVLGLLFLNTDRLIRAPEHLDSTTTADELHGEGGASIAQQHAAPVRLSITTQPSQATLYINGDSVGVTPLYGHRLTHGVHSISVRKENFARLDTIIVLEGSTFPLHLALRTDTLEETTPPIAPPRPTDTDGFAQAQRPAPRQEAPTDERPPPVPDQDRVSESTPPTNASPPTQIPDQPLVGTMHVTSDPPGAAVLLDDERVGQTPLTLTDVPEGLHQITLEREGHQPARLTVQVVPREERSVHRQLTALMGTLKILARPWGSIYINQQLHKSESSIWYTAQVPVGSHQVRVVHPQLGQWEQTVLVTANEETTVVADLSGQDNVP